MSQITAEVELFPLDIEFDSLLGSLTVYEYKVHADLEVAAKFGGLDSLVKFMAEKVGGVYDHPAEGPIIITTSQLDLSTRRIRLLDGVIELIQSAGPRLLQRSRDSSIAIRLLYNAVRHAIIDTGFKIKGSTAFKQGENLLGASKVESQLPDISGHISVHPGFYYRIRVIKGKLHLQITPKSTFNFNTDVNTLIKSGISDRILEILCERVRLQSGNTANLVALSDLNCLASINDKPYEGQNYFIFEQNLQRIKLTDPNARLMLVLPKGESEVVYSTSEGATPSIDFTNLSILDRQFFSSIAIVLRRQSAKRHDLSQSYAGSLKIRIGGNEITLGPRRSFGGSYSTFTKLDSPLMEGQFFRFDFPSVFFRDSQGQVITVYRTPTVLAAPQDILYKSYLPYSVPENLNIAILALKGYETEASKLKTALIGNGQNANVIQKLKCKIHADDILRIDNPDDLISFPIPKCDCAIVVGPSEHEFSEFDLKSSYTSSEIAIMEKGIPVQYVKHDKNNKSYSMDFRLADSNFLFGLGLSIIAKIGGNSIVLSNATTSQFPEDSIVMGYNIARVFEPVHPSVKTSNAALQAVRSSIAISASVSIMDQSGSKILHQNPHIIQSEVELFKSESGQRIIDGIQKDYKILVIHKDGEFDSSELNDIRQRKRSDLKIIPVSIVSNFVPRVSTYLQTDNYVPKPGLVIPLSSFEFLLCTTPAGSLGGYNPSSRGWPHPLMIRIHDLDNQSITPEMKKRILYQIWSLTRSHPASMQPLRRPMSIHYSNKMAKFIRKAAKSEPDYFKYFAGKQNRFGFLPRPFI